MLRQSRLVTSLTASITSREWAHPMQHSHYVFRWPSGLQFESDIFCRLASSTLLARCLSSQYVQT